MDKELNHEYQITTDTVRWNLDDLDFNAIDVESVRKRADIFLLTCSASFVESGSRTYTRNLIDHYSGDKTLCTWLADHWEPEELQHGFALRSYVRHVWPDFDWETAYSAFYETYSKLCNMDELEPTKGQELAARCIVEMGTTTFYQTIHTMCDEPVLKDLSWRIRSDEIRHYKYFYHYFLLYSQQENLTRTQVAATLWRRLSELRHSDADIALRFAAKCCPSNISPNFDIVRKELWGRIQANFPSELAVRMALKPLQLSTRLQHLILMPMVFLVRLMLH